MTAREAEKRQTGALPSTGGLPKVDIQAFELEIVSNADDAPFPVPNQFQPEPVVETQSSDETAAEEFENELPPEEAVASANGLQVKLLQEREFQSGDSLNLGILVTSKTAKGEKPVAGAAVSFKILGTTFRPVIVSIKTQKDGVAVVKTDIPRFNTGRAAILVRAVRGADSVEIRRVVNPA
jgi:hypothetical protein